MSCAHRALLRAAAAASFLLPALSWAASNDISLRALGRPIRDDASDPAVQRFRALSSELTLSLMPKALQPAETLGLAGFELSLAATVTDIRQDQSYWKGQAGHTLLYREDGTVPRALWVPSIYVRKGLPLSTELGASMTWLAGSEMMMLGGEMKIAWHDSFFRWVPALATRFSAARLIGATDLNITAGGADLLMSLPFSLGGMVQVTPFVVAGVLWVDASSAILDETPFAVSNAEDQRSGASGSLYSFSLGGDLAAGSALQALDAFSNRFTRGAFGLRLKVAVFEVIYAIDVAKLYYDDSSLLTSHSLKLGVDI